MRSANYVVIPLCPDHVTLTVYTIKIASAKGTDCHALGNNSAAILEALEEDDDLESKLCDTANNASISQLNYLIRE